MSGEMTFWPWVLIPAVIVALLVNFDARYSGPYFSLSSLIGATEGLEAHFFISDSKLRIALLRRFLYPAILGFILELRGINLRDLSAAGALAAALLVWPALFHSLPSGISKKKDIILLYGTFIGAFAGFALTGAYFELILEKISSGEIVLWLESQVVSMIIGAVFVIMLPAFYRSTFHRISKKMEE